MSILNLRHCFIREDLPFKSPSKILLVPLVVEMELMYKDALKWTKKEPDVDNLF